MATLRVEFTAVGTGRGRLGGQIEVRNAEPLGSVTLAVGGTATPPGERPVVPAGEGTVFASLCASGSALYVDIGASPDPAAEPRLLLLPGRTEIFHVAPGQAIAAMLASEVPAAVGVEAAVFVDRSGTFAAAGVAQEACPANALRRMLLVANPDQSQTLWFSTTGAASDASGSIQVGPGGAVIFDRVVPSGAVSLLGTLPGQPFTVKEA